MTTGGGGDRFWTPDDDDPSSSSGTRRFGVHELVTAVVVTAVVVGAVVYYHSNTELLQMQLAPLPSLEALPPACECKTQVIPEYAFYAGPQHTVRYPGDFQQYLARDAPFCRYNQKARGGKQHTRHELSECLARHRVSYRTNPKQHQDLACHQRRRIYDIWKFNDEHRLLEIRLEENWEVVDYFVIVESEIAFSGTKKELSFVRNWQRYDKYMSKIIHVTCDLSHIQVADDNDANTQRAWPREHASNDCIKFALAGAAEDDVLIYGDTDEIPKPEVLSAIKMCSAEMAVLTPEREEEYKVLRMEGPRFIGSWKWQHVVFGDRVTGGAIAVVKQMQRNSACWLRMGQFSLFHVPDSMWHCSSCFFGDVNGMLSKLARWSELEATKHLLADKEDLAMVQKDCSKSSNANQCRVWTNTDDLPRVVKEHPERWKNLGWTA